MTKYDLEDRLVDFSVLIIEIINEMPKSKVANHLSGQIVRSGTSVALNYGEAQSSESVKDFIHKMKIVLKELRETLVCLKIIHKTDLFGSKYKLEKAKVENNELIAIFVRSIQTSRKKLK